MAVTSSSDEKMLSYGWLKFRPWWLQFLNSPKWFLFFLSQYYFTQSLAISGLYPGVASTIEKRFAFSSFKIGMILSSYEIANIIVTPVVSFLGGSRKKPVFCGWGLFITAAGFFIITLPHFISSPYQAGVSTESNGTADAQMLCVGNLTNSDRKTDCAEDDHGGNNLYYALFILGMVIGGLGFSPLYALGVPYMDQNVKAKVSPMYLGIFVGFGGILGAAVGFVLSSVFLSLFVETGVQTSLTSQDTRWVGNWWLGFAIFGGFGIFWSLWLFGFPKEFPKTKKRREEGSYTEDSSNNNFGYTRLADLPKATKLVFSRLPFVFITIGGCMENLLVTSINAFGPKLLESQFYVPSGGAALLYGLVAVPVAFLGNMLGAYISKRLNLSLSGAAKMCLIAASISLVFSCFLYIQCNAIDIAGVNQPYLNSSSSVQLDSKCNQACNCSGVRFDPVCGGSLTYFSPCHAGCGQVENYNETSTSTFYKSCACVEAKSDPFGKVEKGACEANCGLQLVLFLLVVSAITLMTFVNDTPALIVTLRSIPAGQQPYALGLQSDLIKGLGTIPGPIILGALIDKTCILWDRRCREKGFCLEYDHRGLALVVLGVVVTGKFITTTAFFLSWFFSRRQAQDDKDGDTTTQDTKL